MVLCTQDKDIINEVYNMRLTRKQMAEQFPGRWLGLTDVKYKNDDGVTLESGEVAYTDKSEGELLRMQIKDGKIIAWYTTEDTMSIGTIGTFQCN